MRTPNRNIVLALLAGLIISGMAMSVYLCNTNPIFYSDSVHYLIPIHNLMAGEGYTYRGHPEVLFPPGYGLVSYVFFLFVGDMEYSGLIVSALAYVSVILVAFIVSNYLFGPREGLIAAWLVTFFTGLVRLSSQVSSDALACLCLLLGFYLYLRLIDGNGSYKTAAILGAVLGFSYVLRPEGFLTGLLAIVTLFIITIASGRSPDNKVSGSTVRRPLILILVTVLFLAFLIPYVLFLKNHTGRWTFSTKAGGNLRIGEISLEGPGHRVDGLTEMFDSGESINILQYARSRGKKYAVRVFRNALVEAYKLLKLNFHGLVPLAILWLIYPFVASGRLFANRAMPLACFRVAIAFLVFLSPLPAYWFFFIESRLLVPYSLLLLILLSLLIVEFLDNILASFHKPRIWPSVFLVCLISIASSLGVGYLRDLPRVPQKLLPSSLFEPFTDERQVGYRPAAEWLRKNCRDLNQLTLMNPGRPDMLLFFASGKKTLPGRAVKVEPQTTLEEIVSELQSSKPSYLIITAEQAAQRSAESPDAIVSLWNEPEKAKSAGLFLVHEDPKGTFKVYQYLE
ncbi:ArnT family glycosyltransferase [Thermodesulfobacteriota bacterium]